MHHERTLAVIAHAQRRRERTETREVVPPSIQEQLDRQDREIAELRATVADILSAIAKARKE